MWVSWSNWVDFSHHWTQRDVFGRYDQRRPSLPIAAYMMDWKGEIENRCLLLARSSERFRPQWNVCGDWSLR